MGDSILAGRIYVRNVPLWMSWGQCAQWAHEQTGKWPVWTKLLKAGKDCRSVFLHFEDICENLQEFQRQLGGQYLTHKMTETDLSVEHLLKKASWLKR